MLPEFKNEALTDFSKPENKSAMEAALRKVRDELGREYPLVIGGERITGLKTFDSINPANKYELLGRFQKGTTAHVEKAVEAANAAFESWKRASVDTRASDAQTHDRQSDGGGRRTGNAPGCRSVLHG